MFSIRTSLDFFCLVKSSEFSYLLYSRHCPVTPYVLHIVFAWKLKKKKSLLNLR